MSTKREGTVVCTSLVSSKSCAIKLSIIQKLFVNRDAAGKGHSIRISGSFNKTWLEMIDKEQYFVGHIYLLLKRHCAKQNKGLGIEKISVK